MTANQNIDKQRDYLAPIPHRPVEPSAAQPLAGNVVLDFTRFLPGALATQLLADLGADVIKVEGFPEGDYARGMAPTVGFQSINRNKRSIHVDFRTVAGKEIVSRLIARADAFVEVSRPGSMARYGLDYESVRKVHDDIVYCSVSAYGQNGRQAATPSHGYNMDALAGMLNVRTAADNSPFIGPDGHMMPSSLLGGHAAALAICAALLHRARHGEGALIDASCWDCGVAGDPVNSAIILSGEAMAEGFASRQTPKYAPYRTADDRFLMVCVVEPKFWEGFCQLVGLPGLVDAFDRGHGGDLGDGRADIYDQVAAVIAQRPLCAWEALFLDSGIPVTPVKTRLEALSGALAEERNITINASGSKPHRMTAPGIVINGRRGIYWRSAPELGEDNFEILESIGYSKSDITSLISDEIIR